MTTYRERMVDPLLSKLLDFGVVLATPCLCCNAEDQIIRRAESTHMSEITRVGKRGTVVIPASLRKRYGLEEGREVLVEETDEGLLLRPAVTLPVEIYTKARRAAFLLENAIDREDYERARQEVQNMGLDPDDVPHESPKT